MICKAVTGVKKTDCKNPDEGEEAIKQNERIKIDGAKLSFIKALPSDKGFYKCKAKLGSQIDTTKVRLNVVGKYFCLNFI